MSDATRSSQNQTVIVAGARTPIGRLLGGLKGFTGADLGGFAIKGALDKAGVAPDQVEYVIMGQVLQAGGGQITARQAATKGGIPMSIPAITINKVCLSGLNAIALADQLIRAGEYDIVVAGGMESMTNAPHLLPKSREGFKYGDTTLVDSMAFDGLWDAFTDQPMGALTDQANDTGLKLSRAEQDEFSGGELVMFPEVSPGFPAGEPIEVVPKQGHLVAFLAATPHEVRPVAAGVRDVIVDWFY